MIAPADRVRIAPDVELVAAGVRDQVLDAVFPLNPAARLVLEHADGRSVDELARAVCDRYPLTRERASADVIAFVSALNGRSLVQITCAGGRLRLLARAVALGLRMLPFGTVPRFPRTRRRLDTSSRRAAIGSVALALAPHCLLVLTVLGALGALVVLAAGAGQPWLLATVLAGSALGLVVHEAAHAAALARTPCYLTIGLLAVAVVHAPLPARVRARAAAVGPLAAAAAGFAGLGLAGAVGSIELALASLFALTQVIGLTLAAQDGRTACLVR